MEKTIEIDASVTDAITKSVVDAIQPQLDALKVAKEVTKDKEVNKLADGKKAIEGEVVNRFEKMGKEAFLIAQINAGLQGNNKELGELNQYALGTLEKANLVSKATYMNTGTAADGGVLVPNAELMADVLSLLSTYSPLAGLARTVTLTDGSSIDIDSIVADVVMSEVGAEGGAKSVTKPTLGKKNVAVREFAGIAILTKKLLKQSALDVYAIVRDSFARAIAKTREQLLLTDATSGLLGAGVVGEVNVVGATGVTTADKLTMKSIKSLPFLVPTASASQGTYVFSRLLLGSLAGREDTIGQPIVTLNSTNGGTLSGTFNGYPFVVAETMGVTDAVSTVHAAFGNWGQYAVVVRQGQIDTAVFDSGTVTDGSSVVHNLIQENKVAVRTEIWENVGYPLPGAFATLATAAS